MRDNRLRTPPSREVIEKSYRAARNSGIFTDIVLFLDSRDGPRPKAGLLGVSATTSCQFFGINANFLELIPRNPQQLLVQGFFCLLLCLSAYLFDSFICIAAVRIHSNWPSVCRRPGRPWETCFMMMESLWVRFEQKEVRPTNKKAKKSLVQRR